MRRKMHRYLLSLTAATIPLICSQAHAQSQGQIQNQAQELVPPPASPTKKFDPNNPFKRIAARWSTNQATLASSTSDPEYADFVSDWKGKLYGTIKPTGYLILKAQNGCIIDGMLSPFSAPGAMWTFTGRMQSCPIPSFNQQYYGNVRFENNTLLINLTEPPFAVGRPPVRYSVKATMTQY